VSTLVPTEVELVQVHLGEGAVMDGHPDGALGAILGADGQPITGEV
jgi:hypothetical protein